MLGFLPILAPIWLAAAWIELSNLVTVLPQRPHPNTLPVAPVSSDHGLEPLFVLEWHGLILVAALLGVLVIRVPLHLVRLLWRRFRPAPSDPALRTRSGESA